MSSYLIPLSHSSAPSHPPPLSLDGKLAPASPATVEQIVSVFHAASKQKAWDHFSKAQRKNLDMWRKQAEVGPLLFLQLFKHSIHLEKFSIVSILLCPLCEQYVNIPISPVFQTPTTFCEIHGVVLAG